MPGPNKNFGKVGVGQAVIADNVYTVNSDSELDDIIGDLVDGDMLLLGNADFTSSRTFSPRISVIGTGGNTRGSNIEAAWTFQDRTSVSSVSFEATVTFEGDFTTVTRVALRGGSAISVDADDVTLSSVSGITSITFESGTSNGAVAAISGQVTVTDNGSNSGVP